MDDISLRSLPPEWVDLFVVLAAIFLLVLGIFFWALLIRKRKGTRRRIRRRHHRERHPANPTLAQTGGLPPIREEKKSDGTILPP
ncbi:MAG TPA: hypothetical protein VK769_06045 [Verrucomicrobiae bacterium]|jgi:hypothetical protein|nr:hypothetical protein [Verrucomicrobiae bacterium]